MNTVASHPEIYGLRISEKPKLYRNYRHRFGLLLI